VLDGAPDISISKRISARTQEAQDLELCAWPGPPSKTLEDLVPRGQRLVVVVAERLHNSVVPPAAASQEGSIRSPSSIRDPGRVAAEKATSA